MLLHRPSRLALFAALLLAAALPGPAPAFAQTVAHPPEAQVTPGQAAKATHSAQQAAKTQQNQAQAPADTPVVLDSVIAVINGDVLLQSDVEQERQFEALQMTPAEQNTDVDAAQRLITRTLILQQMKEQGQPDAGITPADVDRVLTEMKRQLPGCAVHRCDTAAGWSSYLAGQGLTPDAVFGHWRQQLTILAYLNLRFRSGIRVPRSEINDYYQKTFVPQFTAKHMQAPPLKTVSTRIQEILLQNEVSRQIDDWEKTLRQQGSVRILVPAYGESNNNADNENDFPEGA